MYIYIYPRSFVRPSRASYRVVLPVSLGLDLQLHVLLVQRPLYALLLCDPLLYLLLLVGGSRRDHVVIRFALSTYIYRERGIQREREIQRNTEMHIYTERERERE